jgi:trigger factor
MLQEVQEITPTTRKLKINIPSDVIDKELSSTYDRLNSSVKVPGFRPGKVPRAILEKKYGKSVEAEIIEKIVPEYYTRAINEARLEPVDYPNIDGILEIKPNQPLEFSLTVEVKPDITDIKYDGIKLEKRTFTVEEDEIEKALKILQESKVLYTVSEDAIGEGDIAVIDAEAFIGDEKIDELTQKDFTLLQGAPETPKEFSDAILGKKKGDVFDVKVNFDKDHPNTAIAGKEVLFKVTITEAKKRNLPPMNDILANEFECETFDELKEKVKEDISKRKESEINLAYKKEIINHIIKENDIDVPASMVEKEINSFIEQFRENAARRGEQETKPEEELRKDYEPTAKENVKSVLLLEAIGKKENIEVTDDDVKEAMQEIATRHNLRLEEVTKLYAVREGSLDAMKSRLFGDKVLEHLLKKAIIQ